MLRKSLSRLLMALGMIAAATAAPSAEPIRIVATVPDLGNIAEAIGGDRVRVKVLAKATEDPHFVDPRPTFVRALNQADMYLQLGMQMESGWAPVLLENARNGDGDVLLVHARAAEEKFVAEGFGVKRFDLMYNDFVLVGPEGDPADHHQYLSDPDAPPQERRHTLHALRPVQRQRLGTDRL